MAATDISTLTAALGGIQLGAAPTRCSATKTDGNRCRSTNCPVFIYDNIDTRLCAYHETYMRGSIFRRCFPDYEDTAFLLNNQPVVVEEDTQDVQLVHRGAEIVAFTGAELDELTDGLHWHIKASLLHYIEDYILFLGDRHDKRSVLSTSNSHFAARYRQLVLVKGGMDDEKLEEFEKEFEEECRREGCAFLFQVDPTSESIEKMDAEGRAASDGFAIRVGFTGNFKVQFTRLAKCSVNQSVHETFPLTLSTQSTCRQPLPMVELLANVIHEMLIAYQHDIWCPCESTNGRTHTQVYWFPDLTSAEPFHELMDTLRPRIEEWLDALRKVHARIGNHL